MPRISKTFIATLLGGLLVTACGGSTSNGTGAAAAITFPLSTALANLYKSGFHTTVTVSGTATSISNKTSYPFTASLSVDETPANAGATFENQAALQMTTSLTGTFNINNVNDSFSSISQNFLSPTNLLLGVTATSYCVASLPSQYPGTITIGQAQSVVTYDCFKDSTKASPTGTAKVSFLVSAGNAPSTATFSTLETFTDTTGIQTQFTQKNFLIDTSGNISFESLSFIGFLTSNTGGTTSDIQLNFKSL
ncbi:hypothetical protein [Rhodoferax sediminis]|uniref:Lipoprotein n=1 Tax=Rhodoferax sediminis TaxID=2509614 RepID=A0A515D886_9BURK|nr:hypothetical protein [Rhodoferax sediminis]QDL36577.1 hypothetical protein EUB48_04140 [Rhodoferax sediminis]